MHPCVNNSPTELHKMKHLKMLKLKSARKEAKFKCVGVIANSKGLTWGIRNFRHVAGQMRERRD